MLYLVKGGLLDVPVRYTADEAADIRRAYEQIQTHKARIPDLFQ